jgi:uncharacterized protein (DUF488 family)
MRREVLTLGHSTHPIDHFRRLLADHGVGALADVRRYPRSRRNPQFDSEALATTLAGDGVAYLGLGDELGGRRRAAPGSRNGGWRVEGFRGYADYMQTADFAAGLERLESVAASRRTVVVCAEEAWHRCHRRLVADALLVRGWAVIHVRGDGRAQPHELTPFALVEGGAISYPPAQQTLADAS